MHMFLLSVQLVGQLPGTVRRIIIDNQDIGDEIRANRLNHGLKILAFIVGGEHNQNRSVKTEWHYRRKLLIRSNLRIPRIVHFGGINLADRNASAVRTVGNQSLGQFKVRHHERFPRPQFSWDRHRTTIADWVVTHCGLLGIAQR